MNNDLISRSALKDRLKECAYSYDGVNIWIMKDEVLGMIDNAPTIEIPNCGGQVVPDTLQGWRYEERPQGEWINPADCICYQCSNCGEYTNNEGTVKEGLFDYCPKCGAKMQKGSAE